MKTEYQKFVAEKMKKRGNKKPSSYMKEIAKEWRKKHPKKKSTKKKK